jgi:hypothetical protein
VHQQADAEGGEGQTGDNRGREEHVLTVVRNWYKQQIQCRRGKGDQWSFC